MSSEGDDPEQDKSDMGRRLKSDENVHGSKLYALLHKEQSGSTDLSVVTTKRIPGSNGWAPGLLRQIPLGLKLEHYRQNGADYLVALVQQERAAGTFFHFAPLLMGIGIAGYFHASAEPSLIVLMLSTLLFGSVAFLRVRHDAVWMSVCAVALIFAGMSVAKIRTNLIGNHSIPHQITGKITGTIVEVTQNRRGAARYLIAPNEIEKLPSGQYPTFIRLSAASKHDVGQPGDIIKGLARLQSISGPAYPGSFDFSFNSWFDGLGGSGFFMGKPQLLRSGTEPGTENAAQLSIWINANIFINQIRSAIAVRIRDALPGENGDVAVALIIGDRTGIDEQTQESLRASGLAHVLAISGMHMALVSLSMIAAVRLALAMNTNLASRYPIKSWAASAGFLVATSYLMLSGMSVATKRAWIMISIVILAMILNRKSITLRGVALAAIVILALQPESLFSPGFQMSFAAVASIVAAYEWFEERRGKNTPNMSSNRLVQFFTALFFTSLIAGMATSIFSAYHFHRIAPLGIVTNMLAMPLVSILVMPFALLSMLIMPYGFEEYPLAIMGQGIDWVVQISNWVNELGSSGVTGILSAWALPLCMLGMFLLTMLKTPIRYSGLALLVLGILFTTRPVTPDIMVSEDGRAIGILDETGNIALLHPKRNKFVRDIWLRAYSRDLQGTLISQGRCDKEICTARTRQGALVYLVYNPKLLPLACNRADILIAPRLRWVNCKENVPEIVLRRGHLEEFGAHSIYLGKSVGTDKKVEIARIERAVERSNRPWNSHRVGRAQYLQDRE